MKYIIKLLISIALIFSVLVIATIVECVTKINYEDVIHMIGNFSIGMLCFQIADYITNKIKYIK